jgi:hypothetical protein
MPLEACPTCGYALSTLDSRCRHCPSTFNAAASSGPFDAKNVSQIIAAVVVLSVVVYLLFFR